ATALIQAPVKQAASEISLLPKQAPAAAEPPQVVTPAATNPAPAAAEKSNPTSAAAAQTSSPTPAATQGPNSTMRVAAGKRAPPPATAGVSDEDLAKNLKSRGLFGFTWFAVIQGLLALLTPCVFPMIPITVSFFTKRDQKSGAAAVGQAGFFSLGI